jgi:Carboxypeptidase regulatory-like domain
LDNCALYDLHSCARHGTPRTKILLKPTRKALINEDGPIGGGNAGAAITIKNLETGVSRNAVANEAGRNKAEALPVGNYEVTGSLTGFQTVVRGGIELTVGRNAVVDLVLPLGDVAEAITVAEAVSQIETTTATVSNLVDERVLEIPLNNRDLTQLAYFSPGVLKAPLTISQGNTNTAVGGTGDKLSVNGARAQQNLYLLNGIPNSDASGNAQAASGANWGAETTSGLILLILTYFYIPGQGLGPNNMLLDGQYISSRAIWIFLRMSIATVMFFNVRFVVEPAQKKLLQGKVACEDVAFLRRRAFRSLRTATSLSGPMLFAMLAPSHYVR